MLILASIFSFIVSLIIFIIVLSVLVLFHELGHFLFARKVGIRVEEFAFGFPPRLWTIKKGETNYTINAIPIGGYVKMYGENLEDYGKKTPQSKRAFWAKSKMARTLVIVAGVVFNFLLAIICFSFVYSVVGIPVETGKIEIAAVFPGSPAEQAGLLPGDVLDSIDNINLSSLTPTEALNNFSNEITTKKGQVVTIVINRASDNPCLNNDNQQVSESINCQNGKIILTVIPRVDFPAGEGPTGVAIQAGIENIHYPLWQMPFRGAKQGLLEAVGWGQQIINSLKTMVSDIVIKGIAPQDVGGPIVIFQVTSQVARTGIINTLQLLGILSVNLAIINILPIPALDGGRLVFIIYELITRRRPKPEIENWVNSVGFSLLILLIIVISVNDLNRILDFGSIFSQFKSILHF